VIVFRVRIIASQTKKFEVITFFSLKGGLLKFPLPLKKKRGSDEKEEKEELAFFLFHQSRAVTFLPRNRFSSSKKQRFKHKEVEPRIEIDRLKRDILFFFFFVCLDIV